MSPKPPLNVRFAIASDLHIGLPHTIWEHPSRFHLIEVSIPAFEAVLDHLSQLRLDFLLLPGDLTQHGERENHAWLRDRLSRLPFPVYVIPGNHDIVIPQGDVVRIRSTDFPQIYQDFGYAGVTDRCDYSLALVPGLRLIGLNSNQFDRNGNLVGRLTQDQFDWLARELTMAQDERIFLMIHHNVIEHMPGQAQHPLGHRYILRNAARLRSLLKTHGVQIIFTGHLHIQDVSRDGDLCEITTGSLVSYPHPYRVLQFQAADGVAQLSHESFRVAAVADWPDLQGDSRRWMGARSQRFMETLLAAEPVNLSQEMAAQLAPSLEHFWAEIAEGDRTFSFPQLPTEIQDYFESFGAVDGAIDNHGCLIWQDL